MNLSRSPYTVLIEITVPKRAEHGQSLRVVGNVSELGAWDPTQGVPMQLNDNILWTASVFVPAGVTVEYKIALLHADGTRCWQPGPNRKLCVPLSTAALGVVHLWENASCPSADVATVTFVIVRHAEFGQFYKIVGSTAELGKWDIKKGVAMIWHQGDIWKVDINLAAGFSFEYKFVRVGNGSTAIEWQPGPNRVLKIPQYSVAMAAVDFWTEHPSPIVPSRPPSRIACVTYYFVLRRHCELGHSFVIVGSTAQFGNWHPANGHRMVWHFNDIWIGEVVRILNDSIYFVLANAGACMPDCIGRSKQKRKNCYYVPHLGTPQ